MAKNLFDQGSGTVWSNRRMDPVQRFWSFVERTDGCWWWRGFVDNGGYGRIMMDRRRVLAHRKAWELTNGPIPDGLCVCHTCDEPLCVRPDHLWLGTSAENNSDRSRKGRTARQRPSVYGRAKLTAKQVAEIRERYTGAWGEQGRLAKEYGVSAATISELLSRKIWT